MAGGGGYFYNTEDISYYPNKIYPVYGGGGFNGGLLLGYDFGLLAGQVELLITGDNVKILVPTTYSGGYIYWDSKRFNGTTIQVPLMLKLDLHWGRIMLQPEAGIYFNMTTGNLEHKGDSSSISMEYENPLFGLTFGGALGFRIGRGYLFLDSRYAVNLGKTKLTGNEAWTRSAATGTVGYQRYF
jgi:hypothetical protein